MVDRLIIPLPELELVEILQRGLRPRIRQQLLYVPITSVAELRKYCLKGESLYSEISKTTTLPLINNRAAPRRMINELDLEIEEKPEDIDDTLELDAITKAQVPLVCWNCKQKRHRYFDCIADRTIFCYGCGSSNVYKPNCIKCNPGNSKVGETSTWKTCQDRN